MFVVQNKNVFLTNSENRNLDTRQKIIYTFLNKTQPYKECTLVTKKTESRITHQRNKEKDISILHTFLKQT